MRTNSLFVTRVSKLRMIILKRLMRHCLVVTSSLSLILSTMALGIQRIGLFDWHGYSIYPLLILISFAFSVLYVYRTKKTFLDELIEIDSRLDLKDKLSTAYEYQQRGRSSLFVDLLTKDAAHVLGLIKDRQIFPGRFSPAHLLIPLFTAVIIVLLSVDFSPTAPREGMNGERIKQIAMKIEKYSKGEAQESKKRDKESRKDLFQKMEKIAKELKNRSMTEQRLFKSLGELKKEAETERTMLANKLENELSLGDTSNTPMLKSLKNKQITSDQLNQVKEQLKELFEGEVPASISRDISDLDQNLRLERFLGETMNQARSALKENDGLLLEHKKEQVFKGEESEETDMETLSGQALASLQSDKEGEKSQTPIPPMEAKAGSERSKDSGKNPDEDQVFTAGRGKDEGEKRSPYELKGSKNQALKDKGVSGTGERYNIHVRSLPTIGKAKLKEEELMRPYRQELENVLKKEDIPLVYREYIKNYFLSIGLGKEEDDNDDTR